MASLHQITYHHTIKKSQPIQTNIHLVPRKATRKEKNARLKYKYFSYSTDSYRDTQPALSSAPDSDSGRRRSLKTAYGRYRYPECYTRAGCAGI